MEEPVYFQPNHTLALNPHNLKRVYGITIEFKQDGKEKQVVRFEIEVLAVKDNKTKTWLFQFDRRNVFINMKKPDTIADKLAHECGQVMYPLIIEVTGNWSQRTVKSRGLAKEKLKTLEEKTRMIYQSNLIDRYFEKAWETLNDKIKFIRSVEQNLFLSFFFAPLYERYNMVTNMANTQMQIPIIPFCRPALYDIKQKVMPNYTRFNTITVIQDGQISDKRTEKDFVNRFDDAVFTGKGQSKKTKGKLQAKYELSQDTRVLHSLTAQGSIALPKKMGRSFELQAYYLSERDRLIKDNVVMPLSSLKPGEDE